MQQHHTPAPSPASLTAARARVAAAASEAERFKLAARTYRELRRGFN